MLYYGYIIKFPVAQYCYVKFTLLEKQTVNNIET